MSWSVCFLKQECASAAAPLPSSDPCRGRQQVVGSGGDATFGEFFFMVAIVHRFWSSSGIFHHLVVQYHSFRAVLKRFVECLLVCSELSLWFGVLSRHFLDLPLVFLRSDLAGFRACWRPFEVL